MEKHGLGWLVGFNAKPFPGSNAEDRMATSRWACIRGALGCAALVLGSLPVAAQELAGPAQRIRTIRIDTDVASTDTGVRVSLRPLRHYAQLLRAGGLVLRDSTEARPDAVLAIWLRGTALWDQYQVGRLYTGASWVGRARLTNADGTQLYYGDIRCIIPCPTSAPYWQSDIHFLRSPRGAPFERALYECEDLTWQFVAILDSVAGPVQAVEAALADTGMAKVIALVTRLGEATAEASPTMVRRLRTAATRAQAVTFFQSLKDPQAVVPLLRIVAGASPARPSLVAGAIWALGNQGDTAATLPIAAKLRACDRVDFLICMAAAEALGQLRDARAVPSLVRVVRNSRLYELTREKAIMALSAIGDPSVIGVLEAAARDPDGEISIAAQRALDGLRQRQPGR